VYCEIIDCCYENEDLEATVCILCYNTVSGDMRSVPDLSVTNKQVSW